MVSHLALAAESDLYMQYAAVCAIQIADQLCLYLRNSWWLQLSFQISESFLQWMHAEISSDLPHLQCCIVEMSNMSAYLFVGRTEIGCLRSWRDMIFRETGTYLLPIDYIKMPDWFCAKMFFCTDHRSGWFWNSFKMPLKRNASAFWKLEKKMLVIFKFWWPVRN